MSSSTLPRRSVLYIPASNEKAMAKASGLPVDSIIIDLEDAVAPEAKDVARDAACAAVRSGSFDGKEVVVRVNGADTSWGNADLAAAVAAGPAAILVPKINTAADIEQYSAGLAGSEISLWAMVETCLSVGELGAIAATARHTPLSVFVMGTNDLAKEMRARLLPGRAAFLPILSFAVAAARGNGLAIIDGVCNEFTDLDIFEDEARQGADMGFDGKTLIHPRQIEICNSVYSPTNDELIWAGKIVAAFREPENAGKGAIRIDGKMVELLHLDTARRTLAIAERIGASH